MSRLSRLSGNRTILRTIYYMWVVFPYPIRKLLTAGGIAGILGMKKLFRVDHKNDPTPMDDLGNLSFWGVPEIDLDRYTLEVTGEVEKPLKLNFDDLTKMESIEGPVRMDCVGGFRNNSTMKGVMLTTFLNVSAAKGDAVAIAFHCADGYYTTHLISDLLESDAFLAYEINGQQLDRFGFPLRLVAPGTYGYKWAKWIVRMEVLNDFPKGYWENKGLPKRGRVGETWG